MPKCPTCGTDSKYNYVGAINVECVNYNCQHFDREAHEKWLADEMNTPESSSYYDYIHDQYNDTIVDPED